MTSAPTPPYQDEGLTFHAPEASTPGVERVMAAVKARPDCNIDDPRVVGVSVSMSLSRVYVVLDALYGEFEHKGVVRPARALYAVPADGGDVELWLD